MADYESDNGSQHAEDVEFEAQSSHSAGSSPHEEFEEAARVETPVEEEEEEKDDVERHVDPTAAADGITARDVYDARQQLIQRRAEQREHVESVMQELQFPSRDLPSLQELREERVRLSEQIRHHKDEQDSLTLDIEGQEGATGVYQVAARVQRFEHFAARSTAYARGQLPGEVEQVVASDQRHSEEEIAAYIQELQSRREGTMKRISAAQERTAKHTGGKGDANAALHPEDDEETKLTIEHATANVSEAQTLSEKVKKFRALKTKLAVESAHHEKDSKKLEEQLTTRIKSTLLANTRDARQCNELNTGNVALTTNAQLLLSQLNTEHYGPDNAPTARQMLEERRAREATPEPTPVNEDGGNRYARGNSSQSHASRRQGGDGTASVSSRQSKPPLVAMKPTEAQRRRDEDLRREREEQRRGPEVISHSSSRRQSLSKPPLVASKPTEAQVNRDTALKEEREEVSVARSRPRAQSISSDARPPSVAGKSTASQRSREAVAAN